MCAAVGETGDCPMRQHLAAMIRTRIECWSLPLRLPAIRGGNVQHHINHVPVLGFGDISGGAVLIPGSEVFAIDLAADKVRDITDAARLPGLVVDLLHLL